MKGAASTAAVLALLALAPSAQAAVEHDASTHDGVFASPRLVFDAPVGPGADRYLLLAIATGTPAARVRAATFGGARLTFLDAADAPQGGCRVEWWGLIAPREGTHQVLVEAPGATGHLAATVIPYRGVDQMFPLGRAAHASGAEAPVRVTIASATGERVVENTCTSAADNRLAMAGAGQEAHVHWSSGRISAASSEIAGAPTVTTSWTALAPIPLDWAASAVTVRPKGAPPPPGADADGLDLEVRTVGCDLARGSGPGGTALPDMLVLLAVFTALRRSARRSGAVGGEIPPRGGLDSGTLPAQTRATGSLMRPQRSLSPAAPPMPPPADDLTADLDGATLARAKGGEPAAQTALVHRYERPVFALLWRMVGPDRAVVEDLTQETFLRVLRALPGFDVGGRARLITWILAIATRLALDHLRAMRPRRDTAVAPGSVPTALPRPDQDAHRRALAVALVEAVDALGPPFRAAFLLREVHGLAYDEIAMALSIDIGTVKSRLARARALLQAALAEMHDE